MPPCALLPIFGIISCVTVGIFVLKLLGSYKGDYVYKVKENS